MSLFASWQALMDPPALATHAHVCPCPCPCPMIFPFTSHCWTHLAGRVVSGFARLGCACNLIICDNYKPATNLNWNVLPCPVSSVRACPASLLCLRVCLCVCVSVCVCVRVRVLSAHLSTWRMNNCKCQQLEHLS